MKSSIFLLLCSIACAAHGQNLLKNSGFEDAALSGWTIENTKDNGDPYYYRLGESGGGHGKGGPYEGKSALEIYSSGRVTRLSQTVKLTPGKYRLSLRARNQGFPFQSLEIVLGDEKRIFSTPSMVYRHYWTDFDISNEGEHTLAFTSSSGGIALDNITLVPLKDGEESAEDPPLVFFDLLPTSTSRSEGLQTCLAGQPQWLNFTVSCLDPKKITHPILHFLIPPGVTFSGLNSAVFKRYRAAESDDGSVQITEEVRDGIPYQKYSIALPRFDNTDSIALGGAWVRIASGKEATMRVEIEDGGRIGFAQDITLKAVDEPGRQATPKKIAILAYHVQDWKQSLPESMEALPRQFQMMGFNIWSDYGLHPYNGLESEDKEEQVRVKAWKEHGVRQFWPNFASHLETQAGRHYPDFTAQSAEPDRFLVKADGTVDRSQYNMRYAAAGGKTWQDSVLASYIATLLRPRTAQLPYTYDGFINDGLERMVSSYDPTTLKEFAETLPEDSRSFTVADLSERLKMKWLSYQVTLYAECVKRWSQALHQASPGVKTVITASSFGPIGSTDLPMQKQMLWAKDVDITMPQWYGFMRYYGSHWHDVLEEGIRKGLYGRENGYADVIPLLNVSMDVNLEDPKTLRFKMFDLLSTSPVVKGIGFYSAYNAFADAQFMIGLSEANTLLADVEDYYVEGKKREDVAYFVAQGDTRPQVESLGMEGFTVKKQADISTSVRVHMLENKDRIALLTVISHCNDGIGERGIISLDRDFVEKQDRSRLVILDRLNGKVLPFASEIEVDTNPTANMALLEIVSKEYAKKHGFAPL